MDLSFLSEIKGLLGSTESKQRHQEDLLTSLLVMAWMVEARDPYTGGHLWRVSQFSQLPPMATSISPTYGRSNSPMEGRSDYDESAVMAMRAAASLSR